MLTCHRLRQATRASAALFLACALPYEAMSANDAYRPPSSGYESAGASSGDAYRPPEEPQSRYEDQVQPGGGEDVYRPDDPGASRGGDSFGGSNSAAVPPPAGYGEPYTAPGNDPDAGLPEPKGPSQADGYDQNEIIGAGHRFFGSISQGLAKGVEWIFKSQGRPNGYILGEDAGGALVVGLRYGEGTLHTKNVGNHKVFWQGPSVGYDAGAEGSKTMILVYNLADPSQIYERYGGVQGAAYLVGGVSVQLQKHGDVTLAVIRSGVGLRLGANVGYMKYTRSPTWNPL